MNTLSVLMPNSDFVLPVPILVLEDEPLIQKRLERILLNIGYSQENIIFAQTLTQARTQLEKHSTSFALVDLGLPDGSGISFIQHLKNYDPCIPILVISAWSTEDMILEALITGATGYVLKERDDLEITLSIRSVLRGGAPIDPFIAQKILNKLPNPNLNPSKNESEQQIESVLSKREHQILFLVAQGLSNKEIADQLNISRNTVESHIKHIYRKLSVCTRIKAVGAAKSLGLLD
ncbi:response regulator transcription factor [Acinetobacter sp. MD2]|uniref:response regulator transcription factor n=1 Tax=Acinetobacter sp. MD2 TaxID=2600066 RepID=UPI002D1EE969|nr:response regulator transcription factor [Acinetobacter sp. MD2]MEB3767317.1 response regulator transcription factor [Acinetobacter sp. MD2]